MGCVIPPALKKALVIAALGWFVAGGVGAVMALDTNQSEPSVSVDRTNKGDRLSILSTAKARANGPSSAAVSRTSPPLGCDPAFSKVAEPQKAHIFGRCAA
jgi:hypothetical protein